MKRLTFIIAVLLVAASAHAQDTASYKFRVAIDPAGGFAFGDMSGTKWKPTTKTCEGKLNLCEVQINANGIVATSDKPAVKQKVSGALDLGFKHMDFKTIRVRCLAESGCKLRITTGPNDPVTKTLESLAGTYIRSGSLLEFSAVPPPTPPSSSQNR